MSRSLRYAPHLAGASVGYAVFAYAAVPDYLHATLGTSFTAIGLLMSAALGAFVVAQVPASRLVGRTTATRALLAVTAVHAALAVALDATLAATASYPALLVMRAVWGTAGGAALSVGATHVARLHSGATATVQQGVFGGMLTLGGAVGFLAAPRLVPHVGAFALHAPAALLAVPGLLVLRAHRGERRTVPDGDGGSVRAVVADRGVVLAAVCYVAVIGSYVTLSTFVTAYFDDLGVTGPLNAAVLLTATVARGVGGRLARAAAGDVSVITVAGATATAGFGALAAGTDAFAVAIAVALPLGAMLAVSVPFGAIFTVAAGATDHEGAALAVILAAGNVAALVLPAVAGALRDATGTYAGGFAVLACVNACGVAAALALRRR